MAIFKGRVRVRYGYSRWGYTRNNGKGWHGGSDEEGLDSTTIRMPDYKGKSISGRVVTARKVDRSTGSKTWEWGWYVCVELDAGQTPDAVNYLYFYNIPFTVIATKCDKLSGAQRGRNMQTIATALKIGVGNVIPVSAVSGQGKQAVFARLDEILEIQ